MYAEERQQAIADLVAQRGRLSVNPLAESTPSPPRPCGATCPSLERLGLLRRVHGGAVPPASLSLIEAGLARARPAQRRREGADRAGRARPAPTGGRQRSCSTPARRPPAGLDAPPRPAADRDHPRASRSPPGSPASGTSTCTCCPAGSGAPPRRRSAPTPSRRSRTAPRRRRVRRHQRASPAEHGLTTPDPDEAAVKRALIERARQVVALADASKFGQRDGRAVRRAPARSTYWSPTATCRPRTAERCEGRRRGGRRMKRGRPHDRDAHRQPEPRPDGQPDRRPSSAARVQRAESVISQAGGKGVNISRAASPPTCPTIAVLPAAKDDPFVLELLRRGHRLPAGRARRRPPREHHDHRARRHHHQAEQPRPAGHPAAARRAPGGVGTPSGERRLDRAGRLAAARRPARVVRRAGRRPARRRRARGRRHQRLAAQGAGRCSPDRRAPPDEAERRGARVASPGTDADAARGRPGRPPPRPRASWCPRGSSRCW